ncbi:MAG: polymerase, sigma 28 subunit, FliA/WhiG family [Clostridiales bacterium]|jgi:RNA polymerase sporulation-specific sigma factor|nr:polymerase, sigma 28 subunit, FliA/WhiG family [Clostridiales bacterium]
MDRTLELVKLAQTGDNKARDTIVEENLGLVWSIVRKIGNRGHETEDIFQIGSIGLIKAIDKFDLSYDVKFSTYAVPMIMGEIKRFLRDDGMIKVSRSLKEIATKAKITKEVLNNQLGREPSTQEIANTLGIEVEEMVMALEANVDVESLYKTIHQGDGNPIYLLDKIENHDYENDRTIDRLTLDKLLEELEPKEKEIILLRYYKEKTQTEIAKEIGISQVQVSRIEKRILKQLRDKLSS